MVISETSNYIFNGEHCCLMFSGAHAVMKRFDPHDPSVESIRFSPLKTTHTLNTLSVE